MIDKLAEILVEFTRKRPGSVAKLVAHVLMPVFVMGLALSDVYSTTLIFDFRKPISVAELRTEIDTQGRITQKTGVALTIEPVESEYRIPLEAASTVWMSIDSRTAKLNDDRLMLTRTELRGKSPLMGVSTPVTVIATGKSNGEIWIPGGTEQIGNWRLEPRRSIAFLTHILFVCVFIFGMSVTAVLPPLYSVEDATTEASAHPN